jgi:DNA-directed RNA polymerase beta subunit
MMDGSPFQKVDIVQIMDDLKKYGIEYSEETLYNGKTGEKMEAKVYTSVCYSQRL